MSDISRPVRIAMATPLTIARRSCRSAGIPAQPWLPSQAWLASPPRPTARPRLAAMVPATALPDRAWPCISRDGCGPDRARLRVIALASEWFPGRGGLSALNRALCRALAAAGHEMFCLVPSVSQEELTDALDASVHLLTPAPLPGGSSWDALLRRPQLPGNQPPDLIIGHGCVTGAAAMVHAEDFFSSAARLQFVHCWPDDMEMGTPTIGSDNGARADDRSWAEMVLARTASRVVAVGPRLHERISRELSDVPGIPAPVRFDPGFDSSFTEPRRPVPGPPRVLLRGRLKDAELKGLDIAARAVGNAIRLSPAMGSEVEFRARGAVPGQADHVHRAIREWADSPALRVVVRDYSTDAARLRHELRLASLVLMPSRTEGFGLAGLEAIVEGTPVLISGNSGLGQLLQECLPPADAARTVIPVMGDVKLDARRWGDAIATVLHDRPAAFASADTIRRTMARQRTWEQAVTRLLNETGYGRGRSVS